MASISSRRQFLRTAGAGFPAVALAAMMASSDRTVTAAEDRIDPLSPLRERLSAVVPAAKQIIFLFQYGGPSTFDLFDYKPELVKHHGQPIPASLKEQQDKVGGVFRHCKDELMAGPWRWRQYGESGQWVSDLMPETAQHMDKVCQIRSMYSESSNHAPATYLMNTGAILGGKPSLGSWVTYGLGSLNQNLPGYVMLYKVGGLGGSANWSNAFLPAAFQGTQFRHEGDPVLYLQPPEQYRGAQRSTLDLMQTLNRHHAAQRSGFEDLEGRIASYELAYRMQSAAMDIGDLGTETEATQQLYGIHDSNGDKAMFGRMCLLSRRLVEKGVRFVQLYTAVDKLGWDGHSQNEDYHRRNAAQTDQPTAALLADLEQRGLLDSTLVIWAGEFGRTPMMQGDFGRNHNPYGFTVWMAGAGVRGGNAVGATDEFGLRAVEDPHPVKDLHATILTALGVRPDELYFETNGRQERLTGVAESWSVIPGVLS
ncbi:MAG: DUF1501 domain-containing protein [Planctomyces sp.]|nr:DUF1501 domain-containing protein [Planctomyces sp.]